MKVMEAISRGFGVSSRSVGILAVLFAFNLIWNLSPVPFLGNVQDPTKIQTSPVLFVLSVVFILLNIFIQGGVLGAVKEIAASGGKSASLGNFARYGGKFYLRLFCLGLIILAGIAVSVLVIGLVFSAGAVVKNTIAAIISGVAGVGLSALALYYIFLVFLAPYALVVDDTGVFKAIKSSFIFVKKNFMKMAGLSTLLLLIGLGLGFVAGIINSGISILVKGMAFQAAASVLTSAVSSYASVMISAVLLIYYSVNTKQG
jgi:hypothetical protein